jgi:hypothetical protein
MYFRSSNENNFNPRILCFAKLSFKIDGAIKVFHDKEKLKQYMTTNPLLKLISKEFCTQKMKPNKTTRGWAVSNHKGREDKESESSIDLAECNQALKQQK